MIKEFKEYTIINNGEAYDNVKGQMYTMYTIHKWDKDTLLKENIIYSLCNISIDDLCNSDILEELLNIPKFTKFKLKTIAVKIA